MLQIYDEITRILKGAPHPRTSVKRRSKSRTGAHNENKARTITKRRSSARLYRASGNTAFVLSNFLAQLCQTVEKTRINFLSNLNKFYKKQLNLNVLNKDINSPTLWERKRKTSQDQDRVIVIDQKIVVKSKFMH